MVNVWKIEDRDLGELVSTVFDPLRDDVLVVVSVAPDTHQPRVDVPTLAEQLPPGTILARLASTRTSDRLSGLVDTAFQCYNGGVRILAPGAMKTDHWRRHPVVLVNPDDDLTLVHQRIVAHVDEAGRRRQSVVERGTSTLRPQQASALQRFKDDLERQRAASPRKLPPASTRASRAREAAAAAETEQNAQIAPPAEPSLLIGMEALTGMLKAQRDDIVDSLHETILESMLSLFGDELTSAQRERSRADAAEIALADAQQRLEELAVAPEAGTSVVFSDPREQLRWEIEQQWLVSTPEPDRGKGLPKYSISDRFVEGLEHPIVPRAKTILVAVDILAGRVWQRHETHQFTDAARGGKQLVREDGAVAWRTYVKRESPGAPRLTWWMLTDNSIELHHVGHHDDLL